jgi:hypothetical protein
MSDQDLETLLLTLELVNIAAGTFLWVMVFRHIKYLHRFYGFKYVLSLVGLALIHGAAFEETFLEGIQTYAALTLFFWVVVLIIKLVNNPEFRANWERGRKNYNNLGALNENWAPKRGSSAFGGAAPPKPRTPRKRSGVSSKSPSKVTEPKPEAQDDKVIAKETKSSSGTPFSRNHNNCATCQLWGGNRDMHASRAVVYTQGAGEKGECLGGGHNRAQVPASGHCSQYQKWSALR